MNGWDIVQLICVMVGILGLMFLLFWALRKLNKGVITSGGKRLKVLDRAMLGNDKSVVVISVAGKCMVIGVTAAKIEKISDLDMSEEEYLEQLYPEGAKTGGGEKSGFFAAFTDALAQNVQGMKKGRNESFPLPTPREGFEAEENEKREENDSDG